MNYLYMPVGIPACGKSSFAQLCDIKVISSDAIREELTGDATNQDANDVVFAAFHMRIKTLLAFGKNVFADATNLKPSSRRRLRDIAWQTEANAVALYFTDSLDFDLCQSRNVARDRVVPLDVMERFSKLFVAECSPEQLANEGWEVVEV